MQRYKDPSRQSLVSHNYLAIKAHLKSKEVLKGQAGPCPHCWNSEHNETSLNIFPFPPAFSDKKKEFGKGGEKTRNKRKEMKGRHRRMPKKGKDDAEERWYRPPTSNMLRVLFIGCALNSEIGKLRGELRGQQN